MRHAALVAVLAAILTPGCNWVFGLGGTSTRPDPDAPPPPDAAPDADTSPAARLTWARSITTDAGVPSPTFTLEAIAPPPPVEVGTLAGPLASASYGVGGQIRFPMAWLGQPWRLAYVPPGEIAHEVQWTLTRSHDGALAVPVFGRAHPRPVPSPGPSGYAVTPSGAPALANARIFTTGVWTETPVTATGGTVDLDFTSVVPLSGLAGAPDPTVGDRAVLVEYGPDATGFGCEVALGFASFASPLVAGQLTAAQPSWRLMATKTRFDVAATSAIAALTAATPSGPLRKRVFGGFAASSTMSAFTQHLDPVASHPLPEPLVIELFDCPKFVLPNFSVADLGSALPLPPIAVAQLTSTRVVMLGPTLVSGIEVVVTSPNFSSPFTLSFDPMQVGIATAPITLGGVDLAPTTAKDQTTLPAGTAPLELDFAVDAPTPANPTTAYEVRLYEIVNGSLMPRRVYLANQPRVMIDRAALTAGASYVLDLRMMTGLPGAATGDFATLAGTQQLSSLFTATFVAP
jgi:hypothetical protein